MAGAEFEGAFADARRAARASWLLERIAATGTLVVRKLGGGRAGELAIHRLLSQPEVTWQEALDVAAARTADRCRGRRIVVAQDTTEINFAGRDRRRRGLGPAGDGVTAGFFIHPQIAIDADDEAVVGVVGATLWSRRPAGEGPGRSDRRGRALEEKESARWLAGAAVAGSRLSEAARVIVVGDRESDIYGLFARRPAAVDLVVRAAQDRAVEDGSQLFAASGWPELGRMTVAVAPRGPGDKGRTARLAVRAGRVQIRRPRHDPEKIDPDRLELTLVVAVEIDPPAKRTPLVWRLLSTLPADDLAQAIEVVRCYRLRWRIEQVFRALKSDGLALGRTQLADAGRLLKLAAFALCGAVRTIQLVDARDGGERPASDVAGEDLIAAAAAIGPRLQGKTQRQQNPHPPASLAWLAWIVARLGGWNCYYKPPGPKTMRDGWDKLAAATFGYLIGTASHV
jgi:hypothetical protein